MKDAHHWTQITAALLSASAIGLSVFQRPELLWLLQGAGQHSTSAAGPDKIFLAAFALAVAIGAMSLGFRLVAEFLLAATGLMSWILTGQSVVSHCGLRSNQSAVFPGSLPLEVCEQWHSSFALGLCALSLSGLCILYSATRPRTLILATTAASFGIALGLSPLLLVGHNAVDPYLWFHRNHFQTGAPLLLLLLGTACLLHCSAARPGHSIAKVGYPTVIAVLAGCLLSVTLWQALIDSEEDVLQKDTQVEADALSSKVASSFNHLVAVIKHIAARRVLYGSRNDEVWEQDAKRSLRHIPGTVGFGLGTADKEPTYTFMFDHAPHREEMFRQLAHGLRNPAQRTPDGVTARLTLRSTNDSLLLLTVPVPGAMEEEQYLFALIKPFFLIASNDRETPAHRFSATVEYEGQDIYRRYPGDSFFSRSKAHRTPWSSLGIPFVASVWFEPNDVPSHGFINDLVLMGGLALSFLVGLSMHLRLIAVNDARELQQEKIRSQAARDQVQCYALVLDLHAPVLETDLRGSISYVNTCFEKVTGLSAQHVQGRAVSEIFLPEVCGQALTLGDRVTKRTLRVPSPEGSEVWLAVTIAPLPAAHGDGEPEGYIFVCSDVTDTKIREAEVIKAKDAAEEATRAKGSFLANISHEIRTPLTSVIGFGEMLLESGLSTAERRQAVTAIIRNGTHLLSIINDILDVSKVEAARLEVEQIDASTVEILSDVTAIMNSKALEKGLELSLRYRYPLPALIRTDPTRVTQILLNLVSNAIKFTARGRVVITVSWDEDSEVMSFAVTDSGIGIHSDNLDKLFIPFSQGDATTTRRFGGTGLGLALSRELARLLGGDITVTSSFGKGSTFTCTIGTGHPGPGNLLWSVGNSTGVQTKQDSITTKNKLCGTVLVVEDGPDNVEFLSFLLKHFGAGVEICENGAAALHRCQNRDFDLVLMDMQMPVMDGYTATRLLRERGYTKPIVALTANTTRDEIGRAKEAGCDDCLGKPFSMTSFVHVLRERLPAQGDISSDEEKNPLEGMLRLIAEHPDVADLAKSFLERLPQRLEKLELARATGTTSELACLAHQLRGASGGYGLSRISQAAADLERACESGSPDDVRARFDALRTEIKETSRFSLVEAREPAEMAEATQLVAETGGSN